MAGAAGSELSRGGMQTKINRPDRHPAGTHMVIASGRIAHRCRRSCRAAVALVP